MRITALLVAAVPPQAPLVWGPVPGTPTRAYITGGAATNRRQALRLLSALEAQVSTDALTSMVATAIYQGLMDFIMTAGTGANLSEFENAFGQPLPGTFVGVIANFLCSASFHSVRWPRCAKTLLISVRVR